MSFCVDRGVGAGLHGRLGSKALHATFARLLNTLEIHVATTPTQRDRIQISSWKTRDRNQEFNLVQPEAVEILTRLSPTRFFRNVQISAVNSCEPRICDPLTIG